MNKRTTADLVRRTIFFVFIGTMLIALAKDLLLDYPSRVVKRLEPGNLKSAKIEYRMYYLSLIPIGQLELKMDFLEPSVFFSVEAQTKKGVFESSLDAKAALETIANQDHFLPTVYREKTVYRGKVKIKSIQFFREEGFAQRGDRKIKIEFDVRDPLTGFFYLLSRDFKSLSVYETRILSEDVIYILRARLIDTKGSYMKLAMDIFRADGKSGKNFFFNVWITNDGRCIPFLFKSWTPVGYATVVLQNTGKS